MALTPFHLQVAGIAVLVLLGIGTIWWIAHIVIGRLRGRPMYILPEANPDSQDDDDPGDSAQ